MPDNQPVRFTVGGAVQANQGTYIERPADETLFDACRASEFCYVLASRQIGKSSLMNAVADKLNDEGIRTARIDLNYIGKIPDADRWYFSLMAELSDRLKLEIDVQTWWDQIPEKFTATRKFTLFLRRVVLVEIKQPVVIFIDEIDMTLGLSFTDDFFAAIRTIYNDRVQERPYRRLTFVLLGVATPDELIKDNTRTPFNIGMEIPLNDFTDEECEPFRQALQAAYSEQGEHHFEQIYTWTNGHPYLTQKLCEAVLKRGDVQANRSNPNLVNDVVKDLFLAADSRGESNLQFVQSRVIGDSYAQEMLRVYKRILRPDVAVPDDKQSPAITRLKLYGLILAKHGQLEVRNKLYTQAFTLNWADEMLKSLGLGLGDKYKILYRISKEGLVTVYLAEKKEGDSAQTMALKVLHIPEEANGNGWAHYAEHLERMAKKVMEVKHHHVVDISDIDWIDAKRLYIAMEYVPTGNLRRRLKTGPLARREAVDVVKQVGQALSYVHEQSIFHLAVNPGDILLDQDSDETLRVVLTDFGFAKFLLEPSYLATPPNSLIPTPYYVAPEYKQHPDQVSPTLDIYGLGVTLFEMLAGQLPINQQPGEPLPFLSEVSPRQQAFFDEVISRAVASEPSERYQSIGEFVEAVETANQQAEQFEQTEQRKRAASIIDAAQIYMQSGPYDYEKALPMVEAALDTYPDYLEALILRGRIRFQQGLTTEAMADYQKAYQQEQDLSSEVGLEYLQILSQMAEDAWEQQQYDEAMPHYRTIRRAVADYPTKNNYMKSLEQQAMQRLIEYEEHKITIAQAEIDRLQTSEVSNQENIFQPYLTIDQAYRNLTRLEPDQQAWLINRKNSLKKQAELRIELAKEILDKTEPDHATALKHYHAIREIEKTDYPDLSRELEIDLKQTITDLRLIVDYTGKYNQLQEYIQLQDYQTALDHLEQEFMKTGNYEYRDVARWLWGLLHVSKEGEFPQDWNILPVFRPMSERLVQLKQEQVEQLKNSLEPWDSVHITETVEAKKQKLDIFEAEVVESIGNLLEQAVKNGVAAQSEIELCHRELSEIRGEVQQQRATYLTLNEQEIAELVDNWLYKIQEAEAILDKGDLVKDIPDYLRRIEAEQQTVKSDPTFEWLQGLQATDLKIEEAILQMKLRIKRRLIGILIDDIGRRDDALVNIKKEAEDTATQLKQKAADLTTALTKAQDELEIEKAKPDFTEREKEAQATEAKLKQEVADLTTKLTHTQDELDGTRHAQRLALASLMPTLVFGGVISVLIAIILQPGFVSMELLFSIFGVAGITAVVFWGRWFYVQRRDR